jgi:hypothetical protein
VVIAILVGQEGQGRNCGGSPTAATSPQGGGGTPAGRHERGTVLSGHCEGGVPPPNAKSRGIPPVERREPTRGGDKGRMTREVTTGRVIGTKRRGVKSCTINVTNLRKHVTGATYNSHAGGEREPWEE